MSAKSSTAIEACQPIVVVYQGHGANVRFAHALSDTVHRLSWPAHDGPRIHHIHGMRTYVFDQDGQRQAEPVEDVARFTPHLTLAGGDDVCHALEAQ